MSDLEHLLENGINAVMNAERNNTEPHSVYINPYEAFMATMDYPYNKEALERVGMSVDTLWEIVQYVYYNIINQED
jgi:hypothetical protein